MCMLIDLLQYGAADQNLGQGYNTSVSRILTLLCNVWQCIIKEQCKLKNFFWNKGFSKHIMILQIVGSRNELTTLSTETPKISVLSSSNSAWRSLKAVISATRVKHRKHKENSASNKDWKFCREMLTVKTNLWGKQMWSPVGRKTESHISSQCIQRAWPEIQKQSFSFHKPKNRNYSMRLQKKNEELKIRPWWIPGRKQPQPQNQELRFQPEEAHPQKLWRGRTFWNERPGREKPNGRRVVGGGHWRIWGRLGFGRWAWKWRKTRREAWIWRRKP